MWKQECKQRPHEMDLWETESWIVKTTEMVRPASRVKQIVIGKMEIPKRGASSELVCVEPTQS